MINDFLLYGFNIANIQYKKNEPLYNKCTFKIGYTADIYVVPNSINQLQSTVGAIRAAEESFFLLGGGSNIVFPDEPYHGLIVSTEKLNNILMTDDNPIDSEPDSVIVTCEAGTTMASFVNFCTNHCLSGAEQFAGLPGTIGGAAYMNARCFEKSISDIIFETQYILIEDRGKTTVHTLPFNSYDWDYKKSPFQTNDNSKIISTVSFKLTQKKSDEKKKIEDLCKKYISERVEKGHFKYPSAGSVFKNNRDFGKPSGQIIDEAGLKGYRIGGAQIAPFHGNFIINIDKAKASDILSLVQHTIKIVKDKFNFNLEPEIIFINN